MAALAELVVSAPSITVVCAPPGFDKSVLLGLACALATRGQTRRIQRFDAARHRIDARAAADAILRAEAEDILIIDNLRGADVAAISEALSARFPSLASPRVWISVHNLKDLKLARFVADGTAQMIDWRNLQLSEADIRAHVDRIPLRFRKVVGALGRTWPAACALLCRWAQQAPSDEADWEEPAILASSGLDGYIEQEIAPLLSSEELNALVHASVAETIEVGTDEDGVTRPHRLRVISRACTKIAGLIERQGNRLAVQPALRHWLAIRFEELPCELQAESLSRAAQESVVRGDLAVAARLYHRAGMQDAIEGLVIEHGSLLIWMTHGFPTIRTLIEQAGDAVVARSSVLQMLQCVVLMKMGRISQAKELFAAIDARDCPQTSDLERDREIVRVALLVYGCGQQRDNELERFGAIVASSADAPEWKSLLATLSCILQAQRARFDSAMASLIDARAHARNADSHYNLLFLSLHEANIFLAQGALKKARVALGDARKRWRYEFTDDRGAETVMSALTASLEYELGQLTSARLSVRKSAYRMPDSDAWFDIYAAAYEPMVRIVVSDHGHGPALETLADQRRKLVAQGLPRVAALLQNLTIVLTGEHWLRHGGEPSGPWEVQAAIDAGSSWQEQETYHLASAYLAMRQGHGDEAERVLRDALGDSDNLKLARSSLRYRHALSALLLHHGDERAEEELRQALLLGARLGARQVFLHTMNAAFAKTVAKLSDQTDENQSGLKRFILAMGATGRTAEINQEFPLSARELEVLRAVGEGGSDKVIGRLFDISEHGVRFHLKSIYRKLNVHDRVSAIHRAKELGAI